MVFLPLWVTRVSSFLKFWESVWQQPEEQGSGSSYTLTPVSHWLRSVPGVCSFPVTFDFSWWVEWPSIASEKTLKPEAADTGSWKSASTRGSGKAWGICAEHQQHLLQIALYLILYFFFFLFHYGFSQIIEYSSLCYTVEPCCLSILCILVCIC